MKTTKTRRLYNRSGVELGTSTFHTDGDGNPAGGNTTMRGIAITWQNGALGRGAERKEPNGAFVDDCLIGVIDRLQYYQSGKFRCEENADAIRHIGKALDALAARSGRRENAGTQGTHEGA